MKSFEKWTWEEVELTFGVKRVDSMPLLNDWLKANEPPTTDFEKTTLNRNLERLKIMADNWNEDEINFSLFQTSSHWWIFSSVVSILLLPNAHCRLN